MKSNDKSLVSFEKVNKSFGATKALINCSVSFEVGKIHALVGENGAGKSTLGKLILGVHKHDSGSIKIDGKESFFVFTEGVCKARIGRNFTRTVIIARPVSC